MFGGVGRRALEEQLPRLRDELGIDFCIVNGENAADGRGITPKLGDSIGWGNVDQRPGVVEIRNLRYSTN